MPEPVLNILETLEGLAAYEGPWLRLRAEKPLLAARVAELREREMRQDTELVIALVGGSGVGKSTLLNALAGDQLAETSAMRPCTAVPTVYHPPGATLPFEGWRQVSGSALEHLVIIDTPDSDTIVRQHRQEVQQVLTKCDLIFLCGSAEKYLDEATWSLLRPLQRERALVCVETKARAEDSIQEHWLGRLKEQGFQITAYFRVNALRTLDRKLRGAAPSPEELDFPKLEQFLREELTADRIARIKLSNAAGLIMKTVTRLDEQLREAHPARADARKHVEQADAEVAKESLEIVQQRLFAESHLWAYALGREMSLRSKGVVGTLYRLIEAIRSLPARMTGWLPGMRGMSVGRRAASLLSSKELFQEDLQVASEEVAVTYRARQSEVARALARAEIKAPSEAEGAEAFSQALNHRVTQVLRGPARDLVIRRARLVTSWPVALLLDLPPLAFFAYAAYIIVNTYFHAQLLDTAFLIHSASVLAIVLCVELLAIAVTARILAWSARRRAIRVLRAAFLNQPLAFQREKATLDETDHITHQVQQLAETIRGE